MKNNNFKPNIHLIRNLTLLITLISFVSACNDDDDDFHKTNGQVVKKYLTKITTSDQNEILSYININYDDQGKVISGEEINNGEDEPNKDDVTILSYDKKGNFKKLTKGNKDLFTSKITEEVYQAYEYGEVINYDDNHNPSLIKALVKNEDGSKTTYYLEITYDDKPFFAYYTLDAAGIIDELNDVKLQFYSPKEITKAKALLPVNNFTKIIEKDMSQNILTSLSIDYVYDDEDYPKSAQLNYIDEDIENQSYHIDFDFKK